jgi:uncharacterized repeat protein (TIGR01451 family)
LVTSIIATLLAVVAIAPTPASAGPAPVMTGYVPMPADQFWDVMQNVGGGTAIGTTVRFTVGITNAGAGAVMYYDHWEDGFEADIANPVQATTEVWGDGNAANGTAVNHCTTCGGDLLTPGDVLIMRNDIPTPGHAIGGCTANAPVPPAPLNTRCYDGRDKVAATRGFALTAGGFPVSNGSVIGGAVSAYDTSKYGTDYYAPVGEDTATPAGASPAFETSSLLIAAAQNNTTVNVDRDADGIDDVTQVLQEGEVMYVDGGTFAVNEGAHVTSDKPVQVHEGTGDIGPPNFESRWFTLFPTPLLSSDYLNPVGSRLDNTAAPDEDNQRTITYLYNPTSVAINVTPTCTGTGCGVALVVPANGGISFASPLNQGVEFVSGAGETFIAVGGVGAQSGAAPGTNNDQSSKFDWGFSLVPTGLLTTQTVLGFAPGSSAIPPANDDYNPVWVTTLTNTTVAVDFDGDPATGALGPVGGDCFGARHDVNIAVVGLASTQVTDPNDNDMSGARIYTCDGTKISGAWGEDPLFATAGAPGFDAGYALIPTTTMIVDKTANLFTDTNGDGKFSPGDTMTYDISIADAGSLAFTSVIANDGLPAGVSYVPGSTVFDDGVGPPSPIADDIVPPAATVFPLDEAGSSLPNIAAGATVHITFDATIDDPFLVTQAQIQNTVCVGAAEANGCDTLVTPLTEADLSLTKTQTGTPTLIGDNAIFHLVVSNAGPDTATAVEVTDLLPAGTTFVSSSASQGSYNSGTGLWTVGTLLNGGSATIDITATINVASVTNFAQVTAADAADPDSQPGEDPLGPGNPPNQDDEGTVTVNVGPAVIDLSVTKAVAVAPTFAGDTVTYNLAVANAGPSTATNVALTDLLPAGVIFQSSTPSQGTYNAGTGVWTVGTILSGGSATLAITVVVQAPGTITNTVEVTAADQADADSTPGNNIPTEDDQDSVDITTTGASIGDFVWYDVDGDGVQDGGEPGMANVTVNATWFGPDGVLGGGDDVVFTTTTDAAGAYTIANLPSGNYEVTVDGSTVQAGINDPTFDLDGIGTPFSATLVLAGGATRTDVDFGFQGIGVIGDEIFNDLDNSGTRDPGEGIPNVTVNATWFGPDGVIGGGDDIVFTTTTDALGVYTFDNLPFGEFKVDVVTASLPANLLNTTDPDGGNDDTAHVTLFGNGPQDLTVDFGYQAGTIDLSVSKDDGGVTTVAGGLVTYVISYGNSASSTTTATNVVLTETVPNNATFNAGASTAGWSCVGATCTLAIGSLAPGATGSANFAVNVASPVPAGVTQIDNTVVVSDDGTHGTDVTPADNTGTDSTPITATPDMTVSKSDGGITTTPGGTVTYAVAFSNVGTQDATGVILTETLPVNSTFNAGGSAAGWSCVGTTCTIFIGNVAAGTGGSVNFSVIVDSPIPAGVTQLDNTVKVADDESNGPDPTPLNNTGTDTTPITADPNVVVTKSDGGVSTTPGGTVAYTITYTNNGNEDATAVVLNETVPTNTTFNAGASDPAWVCVGVNCTLSVPGTVAGGGGTGSVVFAVTVDNPLPAGVTQVSNAVTTSYPCSSGTCTSPPGTDNTPVTADPNVVVSKSDGGVSTTPGGTVAYTITYTNNGNEGATGVVLNETVPTNTTFNAGASDPAWVCVGSSCTLAVAGTVAGGGTAGSVVFAVTVDNPLPAGVTQVSNAVTTSYPCSTGTCTSPPGTDDTPVTSDPNVVVSKSDGGVSTVPGGTVAYTITYTNNGNVGATGVVLNETVPTNTTFNAAASDPAWVCVGVNCTLAVPGTVAGSGGTGSVVFAVTVDNPLPAGVTQVANAVTTSYPCSTGTCTSPPGTDTTPVTAAPDLTVVKDDGGVTTTPGGTVVYVIAFANVGTQDATNVVLTETVPTNTTFNAGASSAGWSCVGATCTLAIGTVAAGGGGFANFAVDVVNPLPAGVTQVDNVVTVADDGTNGPDPTPGDNTGEDSTPVTADPNVVVSKSDGGVSTTPGGTVAYTITYTNNGNEGATGVVLNETVPTNTTFNAGASDPAWVCVGSSCTLAVAGTVAGGGGTGSVVFAVTVDNPLPAGVTQVSNAVTTSYPCSTGTCTSPPGTDDTPVTSDPNVVVSKSDGGVSTVPGGTVAYTVTYTNNGNAAATGVVLNETVPTNTTFNAGASDPLWVCVGSSCTLAVPGTVAGGGGTGSVVFAVTVDNPLPAGVTQVANAVTTSYPCSTGTCTSPPGTDVTPVTSDPNVVVSKTDGGVSTVPGGTVAYTVTYTNNGNAAATGVVLNETVPTNTTFNAGASDPAWVCVVSNCTLAVPGTVAGGGGTGSVVFAVTVDNPLPAGVTQVSNAVTTSYPCSTGTCTSPPGTDDTPVTADPNVVVSKSDGGVSTTPGGTVAYTITYTNNGDEDATGVVLNETVPTNTTFNAGASDPLWVCVGSSCTLAVAGTVAGGGGTGSVVFAVTVDNPLPAGVTQVSNAVTTSYPCSTGTCTSPPGTDDTPVTSDPNVTVTKSDGGVTTTPGGTVAYTITYTNNGNVGATGVVLNETVPTNTTFNAAASDPAWVCVGVNCTLAVPGTVAGSGGTGSVVFAVTVDNPLPAGVTQVSNAVTTSYPCSTGTCTSPPGTDDTPVTADPNVVVSKSDGGVTTTPGGTVAYTITYTNNGNEDATGVVLNETVPTNTTFNAAASDPAWVCVGVNCTLAVPGTVAGGGGTGSVVFAVTVDNPLPAGVTQVSNAVTTSYPCSTGSCTSPPGTDDTPVTAAPDLTVSKTDGGTSTTPGGVVTYVISYSNVGDQGATGVVLTETVPANSTFNAGASTAGWSCVASTCTLAIGTVAAGAGGTANFAVTVDNPVGAGVTQLDNTVVVADDGDNGPDPTPANNTGTDSTPIVAAPDLNVAKTDGGVTTTPGGTVAYTITYNNTGNIDATNVVLTETIPTNTSFNAGASTAGWSCVFATCTLAVGTVVAGAGGSATFAVNVVNPLPAGVTQVDNTVTVADDGTNGPDPTPANNTGTDSTPVDADPNLTVVKDDGGVSTTPGGVVAYTITYTNNGDEDATGVVLNETVPTNTTFNAGASDPLWVCVGVNCTLAVPGTVAGGGGTGSVVFAVTVDNPLPANVIEVANAVTTTFPCANGSCTSPPGTDETPVTAAPDLTVSKTDGGTSTTPGGVVTYVISYSNVGNQAATNVELTETVPANSTFNAGASTAGWSCVASTCTLAIGTVAAGASGTANFAVTTNNPVGAGVTQLDNTVVVADDGDNGPDPTPANNTGTDSTPIVAAPDLNVAKSDGGVTTTPGGTVAYTITYNNTGNIDATNVVLTETIPANTTFNAGASTAGWSCVFATCTLAVGTVVAGTGGSATFAVNVVNPLPAGVTQVDNTVTVADDGTNGPDPTPANNTGTDSTPVIAAPDLNVSKTDGGATATPGGTVTYTITYNNVGNQDATGVVLTETLPANTTFQATGSTPGWACVGSTCTLAIGTVAAGTGGSATIVVDVALMGTHIDTLTNTVTVTDDGTNGPDPTPGDNTGTDTTPVNAAPDLTVSKDDGSVTTTPGGTVAYTISYANVGNQDASLVVLTETIPINATFNAGASTVGWSCIGATCTLAIGDVGIGGSGSAVFAVDVVTPLPAGTTQLLNSVTVSDDGLNGPDPTPTNNTGTDTTPITAAPDLNVTKTDGNVTTVPGGVVTYTITYNNVGNQDATGVTLTETVPNNSTFNAGASTPGWSCVGVTCTLAIGNLAAGGTGAATFAVTVDNPLAAGVTQLDNAVVVADDGTNGPDPTPGDNTGTDTTPITAAPDLSVTKTDNGASGTPGGVVAYQITYANNGNQAATGVMLTETVPTNSTFNAGASTAGWSCVGVTCTLAIGTVAPGAGGTVTFAVTVASPLPAGTTQLANTVTVADDGTNGPDPTPGDNTGTDTTPLVSAPDLTVTKSDGGATTTPGGVVTYAIAFANTGNIDATNVVLTETVPTSSTFNAGASTAGWSCVGATCTLAIGTVAAGTGGLANFAVTVNAPLPASVTQLDNTIVITDDGSNGPDPTPGNNTGTDSTPITAAPDLAVSKTDNGVDGTPGGTVTYIVTYANNGNQDATGVVLTETLPTNTTFNAGASTPGWSCLASTCTLAIGTVPAGTSANVNFAVTINNPLPPGTTQVANTVTVADDGTNGPDPTPGDNTGTDTTPIVVSSIGDQVYLDLDGDGVQDPGETGVAGVTVTLLQDTDNNGTFETTIGTTVTDGSGGYAFTDLPPGSYRAVVTPPTGFTTSTPAQVDKALAANEVFVDADFGLLGATIGDHVWRDSIPNGFYEPGSEPDLSGVNVTLLDGVGGVVATTTTDANGLYAFRGLPAGDYEVQFDLFGPFLFTRPNAAADNIDSDADVLTGRTGVFSIAAGATNNDVDAGMYVGTEFSGKVWVDLDNDGLIDPGEPGIPGTTVTLTGTDDLGNPVNVAVVTDGNGDWLFTAVRVGTYTITETQPAGFLDGKDAVGAQGGTPGNDVVSGITIGEGNPGPGYNFGELPPASVSGVVFDDADGDGIQDPGEPGIAGVTVTLTGTDDLGNPVNTPAITDGSGGYTFANLRPGTYTVTETQPAGFLDGIDNAGTAAGTVGNDNVSGIVLAPGQIATGYTFAETRPGSIGDRVWSDLNGDGVQDPGEPGLATVGVTLRLDADNNGSFETVVGSTSTDGSGIYSFGNLAPGSYQVDVDGASAPPGSTLTTPDPIAVTLTEGLDVTDADFGFQPPAPPAGQIGDTVFSDTDGDGVQDAVEPGLGGVLVTLLQDTDNNGTFETTVTSTITSGAGTYLFTGLPAGSYRVDVTSPSGQTPTTPVTQTVALADNEVRLDVDFGFRPPAPPAAGEIGDFVWNDVNGDGVQDPGEAGVNGVLVSLRLDTDGDGFYETVAATQTTAGNGAYLFGNLPPGLYRIVATVPAGQSATTPTAVSVNLGAGQSVLTADVGLRATPPAPGSIGDRVWNDANSDGVQDPGEVGVNGATVTLRQDTDGDGTYETVVTTTVTAGDGDYSFPNLPPGSYSVVVTPTAGTTPTTPPIVIVALSGGQVVTTADVGLSTIPAAAGSIGDRVWSDTDRDQVQDPGEPGVNGVTVTLLQDIDGDGTYETTVGTTTTSGDGGYTFTALPPGRYQVVITPPAGQSPTGPLAMPVPLGAGQDVTDADFGLATPPGIPFDLELTKTAEGRAITDENVTWLLHVQNNGIVPSPNPITVTDVLPSGLTFVSASGAGWTCTATGQTITCTLPQSLAVGASVDLRITTKITAAAGVVVTNNATVSADGVEITLVNNSDAAVATIEAGLLIQQPATPPPAQNNQTGSLPATGVGTDRLALLGFLLVAGGLGLLALRRRRESPI